MKDSSNRWSFRMIIHPLFSQRGEIPHAAPVTVNSITRGILSVKLAVYSTRITWAVYISARTCNVAYSELGSEQNRNHSRCALLQILSKKLDKRFTLIERERRFKRACDQIVLLNQKLSQVQKRYRNAKNENNRSFRYNYRLQLAAVEGVRNMYYDYACAKADQVAELRRELFNETVEIVTQSDSEYMSDSEWFC